MSSLATPVVEMRHIMTLSTLQVRTDNTTISPASKVHFCSQIIVANNRERQALAAQPHAFPRP